MSFNIVAFVAHYIEVINFTEQVRNKRGQVIYTGEGSHFLVVIHLYARFSKPIHTTDTLILPL